MSLVIEAMGVTGARVLPYRISPVFGVLHQGRGRAQRQPVRQAHGLIRAATRFA